MLNAHIKQVQNAEHLRVTFAYTARMTSAAARLKELRNSTSPRLTVRAMADELGMPFGTYSAYESRYKKPTLPLDLTRRIAAVLERYAVDPVEVMKLAGLSQEEAEPEGRQIEAARPQIIHVTLPVALPSEAALRDMFRSILVLVPEGASKDEAADILARRLPAGLASIGPLALDPSAAATTGAGEAPPTPAKDRPASGPSSHT